EAGCRPSLDRWVTSTAGGSATRWRFKKYSSAAFFPTAGRCWASSVVGKNNSKISQIFIAVILQCDIHFAKAFLPLLGFLDRLRELSYYRITYEMSALWLP